MAATPTRGSRLGIGSATILNLAGQVLPFPVGVVAIPLLLGQLGSSRFGFLSLIWGASAYLSVFDLGLGRATTRAVSAALSTDDPKNVPKIVWSASAAQGIGGILAAVAIAAAAGFLAGSVGAPSPEITDEARLAFVMAAAGIPAVFLASSWRGVLEAHGRFHLVVMIRTPMTVSLFLIPVLIATVTTDLSAISAGLTGVQVVGALCYIAAARRIEPGLKRIVKPDLEQIRSLLRFGGWLTVSDVVSPLLVYSDRFLIGAMTSSVRVAFYTAPFDVITRLWVVPNSLVSVLFPALSRSVALGSDEVVPAVARRGVRYVTASVGLVAGVLAADADGILAWWLGPDFAAESALVLRLLALAVVLNSAAQIAHTVILAFGRSDLPARFHLAELPLQLVMLVVFIPRWGIEGAAAAWTIRVLVDGTLMFRAAARLSGTSVRAYLDARVWSVVALPILMSVVIGTLDIALFNPFALGTIAFTSLTMWFVALDAADRRKIVSLAKRQPLDPGLSS